jgi:hypothetical protein
LKNANLLSVVVLKNKGFKGNGQLHEKSGQQENHDRVYPVVKKSIFQKSVEQSQFKQS